MYILSNFIPLFENEVFPKNLKIAEGFAQGNFEVWGKIRGFKWGTNKNFRFALWLKIILEQNFFSGQKKAIFYCTGRTLLRIDTKAARASRLAAAAYSLVHT